MKTSFLSVLIIGTTCSILPTQISRADDTTTTGQSASASGSTNSTGQAGPTAAQAQRMERFNQMVAQLGLTDAQKDQIRQIRANVTDRQQRHQQIMNILTPDQKNKLQELRQEHRNGSAPSAGTPPDSSGG
jgi:Spy/CpxP family protein refolding chaperone